MKELLTPKVGQFVFDIFYEKRRKLHSITCDGRLFFVGPDREPLIREEFIFPLPKNNDYG